MDEALGTITQEEALQAVIKYKHKELLDLVEEAVRLKRADKEDKCQLDLNLDQMNNESNGAKPKEKQLKKE